MISVCIPTLRSYDTLNKCIESIKNSTVFVDNIYVIDNGGSYKLPDGINPSNVSIFTAPYNLGVAGSWNKFIQDRPEIRIITNDDVEFFPDAIEIMVNSYDPDNLIFPRGIDGPNAFSCFLLPQNIIDVVGLFDETISPNYGYFEDNDYYTRMIIAGFNIKTCDANIRHIGSNTLTLASPMELDSHHKRFQVARNNYIRKWGGLPGHEHITKL